jgi:hypothetical protein
MKAFQSPEGPCRWLSLAGCGALQTHDHGLSQRISGEGRPNYEWIVENFEKRWIRKAFWTSGCLAKT